MTGEYIRLLQQGPFPGRIDPWAEDDHYFQQLHSGILDQIVGQIALPLLERGYILSKEASLQVAQGRKPDVTVYTRTPLPESPRALNYASAATGIMAEPGYVLDDSDEPALDAIYVRARGTSTLVTVLELISPRNKTRLLEMERYRIERDDIFLKRGVNVIEIDLTRSIKRLLEHRLIANYPYHTAIFIPDESVRVIFQEFDSPLKRLALPLHDDVVPVDLQSAYETAFARIIIASQMESAGHYIADRLPFPSLLTEQQRQTALQAVETWHAELDKLRPAP